MPSSEAILQGLADVASRYRDLALVWHLYVGILVAACLAGWSFSTRQVCWLLTAPVASVGVLAWVAGNPFNAAVFTVLPILLAVAAASAPTRPAAVASNRLVIACGASLVLVGWVYPHFADRAGWAASLYAAPLGLLPCPTLALVIGASMLFGVQAVAGWPLPLAVAGLFYGVVGAARLGVVLDAVLIVGAVALLLVHLVEPVCAKDAERTEVLPGDQFIAHPFQHMTHAITIHRDRQHVWPWIAQMGAGSRGGWYSYDRLDNGGQPSARRVIPELQRLSNGLIFPAAPGVRDAFPLLAHEPERYLVLGAGSDPTAPIMTWAFVLRDCGGYATRLIVRVRVSDRYRFFGMPRWVSTTVGRVVHFTMERRQLRTIADRAEADDALVSRFMPEADICERHHIAVQAPAETVFDTAAHMNLQRSLLIRAIFKTREFVLRAHADHQGMSGSLLADMQAIGWRVLALVPGREVVVGAVTRPWEADVTFRPVAPEVFRSFSEPGFVKIVWTLRADPVTPSSSIFRTETRVWCTDEDARTRFRRYWSRFSPGIVAIRWLMLRPLKSDAESRFHGSGVKAAATPC